LADWVLARLEWSWRVLPRLVLAGWVLAGWVLAGLEWAGRVLARPERARRDLAGGRWLA